MNNSSLVRVHRLKCDRPLRLSDLVCDVACQIVQRFRPAGSVSLRVKLDTNILICVLVDNKAREILKGGERLSSLADQKTHVLAVK